MMDRDDIRELFSPFIDGELDAETRARVEGELAQSEELRADFELLQRVSDHYAALEPVAAPQDFEDRVRDAIQAPNVLRFSRRLQTRRVWPLAVAAALLLCLAYPVWFADRGQPEPMMLSKAELPEPGSEKRGAASETLTGSTARGVELAFGDLDAPVEGGASKAVPEMTLAEAAPPREAPEATTDEEAARKERRYREQRRSIADTQFVLDEDVWHQAGYDAQTTVPLYRSSSVFETLRQAHEDVEAIAALGPKVIFKKNDIWYFLQPEPSE